jgi:hypothetical protein
MSHVLDDLPTLADFRDQLAAVARAAPAPTRRSRLPRPRPGRRLGATLGAAALALAASAAAATLVGLRTVVIPGPQPADVAPQETIVAGSDHLLAISAADPSDGTTWTLRAARTRSGERCLTVGQRRGTAFGLVGLDGRFRLLSPALVDGCGTVRRNGVSLLGARVFDARRRADVRTVIYGSAGAELRTVRVAVTGRSARSVPITRDGAFATVLAGYPEDRPVSVTLRFADGHRVTRRFGHSRRLVTGAGAGSTPALALGGYFIDSAPHTACLGVHAARHVPGAGSGPSICGSSKPARPFGAVRAVRPGRHRTPGIDGYDWGTFPARTLVFGSWPRTGPRLRSVVVHAPTGTVRARIVSGGRSFLVALPARARPAQVSVTVTPRTGAPVTFRGSIGLVPNPMSK